MKLISSALAVFLIIFSCQNDKVIQTNIALLDSIKLTQLIEENKKNVFIVNVWATWCVPCVEEMPDLIKLKDYYKNKNVKIIGVSIDYPEEIESKVVPFIQKHNLNFPVFVNNFRKDELFINFLNQDWSGAVPATFIYDKNGIQKEFLLGKHSFDDFKSVVEKYL